MIERRILYFSEVIEFFSSKWIKVLIVGSLSFSITFTSILLFVKPRFRATATFKQAKGGLGDDSGFFQAFLKSMQGVSEESGASGIMQSKTLLSHSAKKVGLQSGVFGFRDVEYLDETPSHFTIIPIDHTRYEVVGLGEGRLGESFVADGVKWTLHKMPDQLISVKFTPMQELISQIQKQLKIKSSRIDPQLLNLSFYHRSRGQAVAFLDELMTQFAQHLEKEHERIASAQISYLQKRRDQLSSEFDLALDEHVAYLESKGNLDLSQELQILTEPKETYLAKKHQLDLELRKWKVEKLEAAAEHPWNEALAKRDELRMKQVMMAGDPIQFEEYLGIDLKLAEALFDSCASERDSLTQELFKIERVLEKIDQEGFTVGNLGTMLQDPVSLSIITKASQLAIQIADEDNYTTRELKAKAETLDTQKLYLKEHLQKEKTTLVDRLDLTCEKLAKLRSTALDLLEKEKHSVELKLQEIGGELQEIPAKWRKESELKIKRELTMQIMEGLCQLSESKVINHHLFHVESGPLDCADAPLKSQSRHLFLLSTMGGVCGTFFYLLFALVRGVSRGLPVSRAYLLERGYHLIEGPAKIEKIALHIQPDEVVALIGIDFAQDLFNVLKNRGYVVTVEKMPQSPFLWEKPQGCVLVNCEGEKKAVGSVLLADRFVICASGKRPEDLDIFPKQQSHFLI